MQKNLYKGNDKTSPNFVVTKENIMGTTRYDKDYTYNKDVQGSTTSVVGQDGSSTVAYDYDDFGVTRSIGDSTFFNEVCYTGGIYDVSTGMYYLNSRYYDPKNGRFITQDTYRGDFNKPSSLHLYTYCINNPIKYYDPSGRIPFVIPIGIALSEAVVTGLLHVGLAVIVSGTTYVVGSKIKNKKHEYYAVTLRNKRVYFGSSISKGTAVGI
ncbi:RHS repeat-associated core domain-containing protein [Terrisporobacter petrolearius]|uniref:RHS repeat-associated core domain-containing protein n=1 Tax=Terrisporobacter petrolearius TaxID=1460447 RepID=UPI0031CCA76E